MNHRMDRANGVLLHYVTAGNGEPVVLLHGFAQTWYEWKRSVIPALAEPGMQALKLELEFTPGGMLVRTADFVHRL